MTTTIMGGGTVQVAGCGLLAAMKWGRGRSRRRKRGEGFEREKERIIVFQQREKGAPHVFNLMTTVEDGPILSGLELIFAAGPS